MIIPWQEIDQETLNNLMESVVLREGTDYGSQELSFETKVEQLKQRLKSGAAVIVYSELHESVDVVDKDSVTGSVPDEQ
ncbi:YheU family protein [Idiomarina sp. HP20-50]|uniref:YheU family protein n=1 Tax=Idiomarina sp. HP20-50 TaxID=3070813 RepID=UPI00294B8540|nr:YheU family protein [Idiomarina sp. HP20-50]MDV6317284.1 YheU family protein [Idiomarina sp. HP20-50]